MGSLRANMGRKPSVNHHLPPHMRARRRGDTTYYYYDEGGKPRREISLGTNYVLAIQKWAELNKDTAPVKITVGFAIAQYMGSTDYLRLKPGTQDDYRYALEKIIDHFSAAPLDEVKPSHIQLYIDKRTRGGIDLKASEHRALREISCLGMIYRYAQTRDWTKNNPVKPIRRRKLPGRKYIEIADDILKRVYDAGSQPLRDAIDIAYLIGQRPGDVIAIQEHAIKAGMLAVRQAKTGALVKIPVEGDLATVIDRINARKQKFSVRSIYLLVDEKGERLTKSKLRSRFEKAREAVGQDAAHFQFRDLRRRAAADLREQSGINAAQDMLGHASVTMTEHYTATAAGRVARFLPAEKWKGSK